MMHFSNQFEIQKARNGQKDEKNRDGHYKITKKVIWT